MDRCFQPFAHGLELTDGGVDFSSGNSIEVTVLAAADGDALLAQAVHLPPQLITADAQRTLDIDALSGMLSALTVGFPVLE